MKTAISLPDALFKAAETLANRLGVSRSELYQTAIARLVADHEEASITEALNRIYPDPGRNDGRLDQPVEHAQAEVLDREDW